MSRLLLIVNPAARRVTAARQREVVSILSRRYRVETIRPASPRGVVAAAAAAAGQGLPLLVAMGGDGVVSTAMNGIVGTPTRLAIIPAGTTNAWARSLGVPLEARAAAGALVAGVRWRSVPLARLVLRQGASSRIRHALAQVGLGFDAEVVLRVEGDRERKRRFGSLFFAAKVLAELGRHARAAGRGLQVSAGGRTAEAGSVLIQVRWPYTYLGPRPLAFTPAATGGADVLLVQDPRLRAVVPALLRCLAGWPMGGPGIQVWPGCRQVSVRARRPTAAQADGEPLGALDDLQVTWEPAAIQVATP